MDLSTLAAPAVGAIGDAVSHSAAQATAQATQSLTALASAVRQFARTTWGVNSDLARQSSQLRAPSGGKSGGQSGPFAGLSQIGSFAKTFGSGFNLVTGIDLGGPISIATTAIGMISSLFGSQKMSVGPGGGAEFGLDATGKARLGITNADNGYDPSVNQSAADAVGAAAVKFFGQIGGSFKGTAVEGFGGYLGYDAGAKRYLGGESQGLAQQFKTAEQAAQAALVGVIKNAQIEGISKDLQDRIHAISSTADLEALLGYVDQLRQLYAAFTGWTAPMTAGEQAMRALNESFAAAKGAAESLSQSVAAVQSSYEQQRAYLTRQFVDPLETRYLRATGAGQAADLRDFDAKAAIVRRDAAALGSAAVLQAEKTLGAERAAIVAKYQLQILGAATQIALTGVDSLQATYDGLTAELKQARSLQTEALARNRDLWAEVASGVEKVRAGLLVGALSPLDPLAQMQEAQRQLSEALSRARSGDVAAAGQAQNLAQQALTQTQSYYGSGEGYAAYFQAVQDQLAQLQVDATARAGQADQQIAALRGTEANTRAIADINRDMVIVLQQIAAAQRGAVTQAAGGGATGAAASSAIYSAYQQSLGRAPDQSGATYWANQVGTGASTVAQVTAQIANSNEAKVYAAYQEILGRAPDPGGGAYWQAELTNGASIDSVRASMMASAEYKALKGFATGGDHAGGWRIVGERGPELEATGPARIWNFDQTQRLLSNDNAGMAAAMAALGAKLDALIRVSAAAGDGTAQGIAGLRDELADLSRRARLTEAA